MPPSRRLATLLAATLFGFAATGSGAATLTVTSTADGGPGTLRQALAAAAVVEATTVAGNTASLGDGGLAGGIFKAGDGSLTIRDSAVSGNEASSATDSVLGGGIVNAGSGSLTIVGSIVSGNRALSDASGAIGGGIFNSGTGPVRILNSTVSGNEIRAGDDDGAVGGGIFNSSRVLLSLLHATVVENVAQGDVVLGGGLFNSGSATSRDSILAGNAGGNCWSTSTLTAGGTNLSDDGTCPGFTQVTGADLDLGPLQDNGGPTFTHALSPDSVAVDAAGVCKDADGNPLTVDQRGLTRPIDGTEDGTAACDVGAFELNLGVLALDVDPGSAAEGETSYVVTVSVTSPGSGAPVTVDVVLDPSSTALAGADILDPGFPVPVTFDPGVTEQTVDVTVLGDQLVEPDETIVLALANPTGGFAVDPSATAVHTILNDDGGATFAAEKTVAGGGTVLPGSPVDYTILLTNLGPDDRADLPGDELVDVLPPELALLSATADTGTATADPATNTVTWNGALGVGESAVIAVQARVAETVPLGVYIANLATLSFDFDGDGAHDTQALSDDPGTPQGEDPTLVLVAPDSILGIPTLGTWALGLLALGLAALGALRIRA